MHGRRVLSVGGRPGRLRRGSTQGLFFSYMTGVAFLVFFLLFLLGVCVSLVLFLCIIRSVELPW